MSATLLARTHQGFSRSALLLNLLRGHGCAGLFLSTLKQGPSQIDDPAIRQLAMLVHQLLQSLAARHRPLGLVVLAPVLLVMVLG